MSCPPCYQNSCPEIPEITINQTTITLDGSDAFFKDEYYKYQASGIYLAFTSSAQVTLSYYPVSAASVTVYRNGKAQRYIIDYNISDKVVIFTNALGNDEEIKVTYFTYTGIQSSEDFGVGTVVNYTGGTVPVKYLVMDGVSSYLWAGYPDFNTWAVANWSTVSGFFASGTATPSSTPAGSFILAQVKTVVTVGGVSQLVGQAMKVLV